MLQSQKLAEDEIKPPFQTSKQKTFRVAVLTIGSDLTFGLVGDQMRPVCSR